MNDVTVIVTIDTEEDNWAEHDLTEAMTRNIAQLPVVQEIFDRWAVRPTYLVNYPPLLDRRSVAVLGDLADRPDVEIGAHCHPWNTPPFSDGHEGESMMWTMPLETNRRKIHEIVSRLERELGVRATSFRTGRWSFGPWVARALEAEGIRVDASVTPFIDWSRRGIGGPDYSEAPHLPYRFHPSKPLHPDPEGPMIEVPPTIGFIRGDDRRRAQIRTRLERSPVARFGLVGLLDRLGILRRRLLSPEASSGSNLRRLTEACVSAGRRILLFTFHSPSLLPGLTPFVRDRSERDRFLQTIDDFLGFCSSSGFAFGTLSEVGFELLSQNSDTRALYTRSGGPSPSN